MILAVGPGYEPDAWESFAVAEVGAAAALAGRRLDRGYALLARGDAAAALVEFARLPTAFYATPTALAAARHARGEDDLALASLDDERDALGAALLRGDVLRARGDVAGAARAFNARDVRLANPTEQAWAHLSPPPRARLDVGDGLDLGYLRGFALDEREPDGTTLRWTGPRAELCLTPAATGPATLRLRLRSYRPGGAPLPPVRVSVDGRPLGAVAPAGEWRVYDFPLTAVAGEAMIVRLDTATFVPGYADPRQLGALLDWVEVVPASAAR